MDSVIIVIYTSYILILCGCFIHWKSTYIEKGKEVFHVPIQNWNIILVFLFCWFPIVNIIMLVWLYTLNFAIARDKYTIKYKIPNWLNKLLFKEWK